MIPVWEKYPGGRAALLALLGSLALVALVGVLDFLTGTELRVYPLYFAPLILAAWFVGRNAAVILAMLGALTWAWSNLQAGKQYSQEGIWIANTVIQAGVFALIAILVAALRRNLLRERELSRIDPLTGLANFRGFLERGEALIALARRQGWMVTLAYLDLDGFKKINDTRGHAEGDRVLREVAQILRRELRAGDVTARLGGDEFALFLPDTEPVGTARVLETVRTRIGELFAGETSGVSVSVGAVILRDPPGMDPLLARADALMYQAKSQGKNRLVIQEALEG